MFKPLNVPFFQALPTKDEVTNRVQLQVKETVEAFDRLQENLFLLERHLRSENVNVKDTVIFQNRDTPYVSTDPTELQPPVHPIGIGREAQGRICIISTILHYSNTIDAGVPYGLNANYLLIPIQSRQNAVVIGVAKGVGIIVHQNLPQIRLS